MADSAGMRGNLQERQPLRVWWEGIPYIPSLYHGGHTTRVYIPLSPWIHPSMLHAHSRRVYTDHAGNGLTALEHGVTVLTVSGLLIYRVTVRQRYRPSCSVPQQ